jgi:hypothetical protein
MQDLELFLLFCRKFHQLDITYMVSGSVASILYGEPRLTHDIDIVVRLDDFDADTFCEAFPPEEFYCPPQEILILESKRRQRGHFNLIHYDTGFKADVYIAHDTPFYHWAFRHTNDILLVKETIRIAPPEYVIVGKLTYYREVKAEKHLIDIRGMLENVPEPVDWKIVEAEVLVRGLKEELALVKA